MQQSKKSAWQGKSASNIPNLEIAGVSRNNNPAKWSYPYHVHNDAYELIYITEGNGFFMANNHSIRAASGMIFIVCPGVYHYLCCPQDESMVYHTTVFSETPASNDLFGFLPKKAVAFCDGTPYLPHIQSSFDLLFSAGLSENSLSGDICYPMLISLILLSKALLLSASTVIRFEGHVADLDRTMFEILKYITENFQEKITLQFLSDKFSISSSYLSHVFTKMYGYSPIEYLIRARVVFATEHLKKSDMSIEQIAEKVGYTSTSHFIQQFAERIGETPADYRRKFRQNALW